MAYAGEVVIVSGPPGAGKSTIAAALATEAELGVHLESDWFYRSIRSGFVGPHLPEAHAQNTAMMDVAADTAASYAAAGYVVFWDGIVGPWFLDRVAGRLAARGTSLRYVVLRPSKRVALDRVRSRDVTTEVSGVDVMFEQFVDLGEFESHVIDSEGPAAAVVARCRSALESDGFRLAGEVWVDDRWPVSVKGVLGWESRFVVLRNERGEWELPGGRLDATDPDPVSALRREMQEELGLEVEIGDPIDSWIYDMEGKRVLVLTYRCEAEQPAQLTYSKEHSEVALLTLDQLATSPIPAGYLQSIRSASSGHRL